MKKMKVLINDVVDLIDQNADIKGIVVHGKEFIRVVRCKDCKYYLRSNEKCQLIDTRLHFYETDKLWTEDTYCSWGERREDAETD